MNLDPPDHEIFRFCVSCFAGVIARCLQVSEQFLIDMYEVLYHILCGGVFGDLSNTSHLSKVRQPAGCKRAFSANSFCDLVNRQEKLVILLLECSVQREERRAAYIPVTYMCLTN